MKHWSELKKVKLKLENKSKKVPYVNNIIALDTETTSLFIPKDGRDPHGFDETKDAKYYSEEVEKVGICYIWMLSIDDTVYYGRELNELTIFVNKIVEAAKGRRIVIHVHNFGFDFQFLRNVFEFSKVFARQSRTPLRAEIEELNVEFRDTYIMSNLSLEKMPKQFNLPVKKLTGDLDYELLRHSKTPLTDKELDYCEHDCLVIYEYIKKMLEKYGSYKKIPMTSTGQVRRDFEEFLRENAREQTNGDKWAIFKSVSKWKEQVSKLVPVVEDFKALNECFAGGYTHANADIVGETIKGDITSYDFTSSYPFCLLVEKYPCTRFTTATRKQTESCDIDKLDFDKFAFMFELELENIESIHTMPYISGHRAMELKGFTNDNGRIESATHCVVRCTEQDWLCIKECYGITSKDVKVRCIKYAKKNYLPKAFILFVMKCYKEKNIVKKEWKKIKKEYGDASDEFRAVDSLYSQVKARLNSLYGMCVTNYISDEITFDSISGWGVNKIDGWKGIEEQLHKQRDEAKILLPYQWGVWIPAYARRNICRVLYQLDDEAGCQLLYCDTDSAKFTGDFREKAEIYNIECREKIKAMGEYYKIDVQELYGAGELDDDGHYAEFRTLGAKKYAYKDDKGLHITISGVNKIKGAKSLKDIEEFKTGHKFGYKDSGSKEHFYNDEQPDFSFTDYQGNTASVSQQFGICLKPTTYELGMTGEYKELVISHKIGCSLLNI